MTALPWFLAFLGIASLAVAVLADGGEQVDALLAEPTDADVSDTPIHDALAVEVFRRELDERLSDGLRDWGKDGAA